MVAGSWQKLIMSWKLPLMLQGSMKATECVVPGANPIRHVVRHGWAVRRGLQAGLR